MFIIRRGVTVRLNYSENIYVYSMKSKVSETFKLFQKTLKIVMIFAHLLKYLENI